MHYGFKLIAPNTFYGLKILISLKEPAAKQQALF